MYLSNELAWQRAQKAAALEEFEAARERKRAGLMEEFKVHTETIKLLFDGIQRCSDRQTEIERELSALEDGAVLKGKRAGGK